MSRGSKPLLLAVAVCVVAAGVYVFMQVRESLAEQDRVAQLLLDVSRIVQAGDRNAPELSRLVDKLEDLDASDPNVALALARIDVLRGRYQRAVSRLEVHLFGSTGELQERTAAIAYAHLPLRGGDSELDRRGMWQRAEDYARKAHDKSGNVEDLFLAWQSASRRGARDAATELAGELGQLYAGSLQERTVRLLTGSNVTLDAVDAIALEWSPVPIEVELARNMLLIAEENFETASDRFEALLQAAPNLIPVRHFAALALHGYATRLDNEVLAAQKRKLRDAQLTWLLANAPVDHEHRALWSSLRGN